MPLPGCVHFCEVDVVLANDSILVSLEGSVPGEAGNGRTHNVGQDIAGSTGRSWRKRKKKQWQLKISKLWNTSVYNFS